ncbi:MAG: SDR family NAD(P)-dependent oxidoreductase [Hyphomonadaceae bacterium]
MIDIAKLFALDGKTAVVTGGSRGIGHMIAEGLIASGMNVHIVARKKEEVAAAVERLGPKCKGHLADLATRAGIEQLVAEVGAQEKKLHILVNNAGATWGAPLDAYPYDKFERVLNVNVTAPFALTQGFLPLLRAAATQDDPARVINVASISAFSPQRAESYAYGASKAGVVMLTRHLAGRLAREHITVNAIAPGFFPTKMMAYAFENQGEDEFAKQSGIPMARAGRTEDAAGAAIYLASRAGAYVTGAAIPVCGGAGTTEIVEDFS